MKPKCKTCGGSGEAPDCTIKQVIPGIILVNDFKTIPCPDCPSDEDELELVAGGIPFENVCIDCGSKNIKMVTKPEHCNICDDSGWKPGILGGYSGYCSCQDNPNSVYNLRRGE